MAPVSTRASSIPRPVSSSLGYNATLERLAWMVGSLVVLAILWQIIAELLQNRYLPTPVAVFDVLMREAENGELWKTYVCDAASRFLRVRHLDVHRNGNRFGARPVQDRRPLLRCVADLVSQPAGARDDNAVLHLVRADRRRRRHGRCLEQNSECRGQHAGRRAQSFQRPHRDGDRSTSSAGGKRCAT